MSLADGWGGAAPSGKYDSVDRGPFNFDSDGLVSQMSDGLLAFEADPRVESWLEQLGLQKYTQLFAKAEVVRALL